MFILMLKETYLLNMLCKLIFKINKYIYIYVKYLVFIGYKTTFSDIYNMYYYTIYYYLKN